VRKNYYLSEMPIADDGGGGLTLQRVLQCDLNGFDLFIHVHSNNEPLSVSDRLADRQLNLHHLYPVPTFTPQTPRSYFDRALDCARFPTTYSWTLNRWGRRVAAYIARRAQLAGSSWLVVPQGIQSVLAMNHVWKRHPVRYVTWMMDDHVLYWKNRLRYPFAWFENEFAFHLRNAHQVFVISPAMQQFYREKFGVTSEVLFGPADLATHPVYQSQASSGPIRLAYFGSLWTWQRDALARLISHLAQIDATLDVFGFNSLPVELKSPRVCARPPVPAEDVISHMREYDGVVIPAGFVDEVRNLSELNISTKLSECLTCGTLPILIAPEFAAMTKFVRKHGGALVVSDFSSPDQINELRAIKSTKLRRRLLDEARRVAVAECSSAVMRSRWDRVWRDRAELETCASV
jgi:hypothetical protein